MKGKEYLVAVDPAGGGSDGDFSAAEVLEMETGLQCAEFAGHVGGLELARLVTELAEAGLGGVEAVYGRYTTDERRALKRMARRCGLVATGGSDYHGSFKPDLQVGTGMGDLDVPDSALDELAARCP